MCNFATMKAKFMIAAPMSGSGKTTIARGLMALLTEEGYRVQPFKCGPDYIDTKFHEKVCGRPSINLDTFMATPEHVRQLFERYGADADVCIVEAMMGLFDGYDKERGSSYEIARILDLPIVLVVDAKSAAYSMAALLQGFVHFRNDVHFAGVIFNKVGSEKHYAMLRQVCDEQQIACLGYLPKSGALEQDSRYLGLDFSQEAESRQLLQLLKEHVDISSLRENNSPREGMFQSQGGNISVPGREYCVSRAFNEESFSFVYQETIDAFPNSSVFDPEHLCESILTDEGEYPMCGVLPYKITARKADRHLSLGYRRFTLDGKEYRGHEFHYSQFLGATPPSAVQVYNAKGEPVATPVFKYKNVLASYTHLYPL